MLKFKTMDINTKITTKTASGRVIRQSVEKRIDWCNMTRAKLLFVRTNGDCKGTTIKTLVPTNCHIIII